MLVAASDTHKQLLLQTATQGGIIGAEEVPIRIVRATRPADLFGDAVGDDQLAQPLERLVLLAGEGKAFLRRLKSWVEPRTTIRRA